MKTWIRDTTEQGMLQIFQVFSRGLAERPGMYGVNPADVAEAVRLVKALEEAIAVTSNPATRTSLATAAKREALSAARSYCNRMVKRSMANYIGRWINRRGEAGS